MAHPETRRDFLKKSAVVATALARTRAAWSEAADMRAGGATSLPWYRRTLRWGQTNITEIDPERYEIAWWRKYWRRTETQGVIINAGGIIAYYPSQVPGHRQAQYLNGRD